MKPPFDVAWLPLVPYSTVPLSWPSDDRPFAFEQGSNANAIHTRRSCKRKPATMASNVPAIPGPVSSQWCSSGLPGRLTQLKYWMNPVSDRMIPCDKNIVPLKPRMKFTSWNSSDWSIIKKTKRNIKGQMPLSGISEMSVKMMNTGSRSLPQIALSFGKRWYRKKRRKQSGPEGSTSTSPCPSIFTTISHMTSSRISGQIESTMRSLPLDTQRGMSGSSSAALTTGGKRSINFSSCATTLSFNQVSNKSFQEARKRSNRSFWSNADATTFCAASLAKFTPCRPACMTVPPTSVTTGAALIATVSAAPVTFSFKPLNMACREYRERANGSHSRS
mmetsp:Transcript_106544/g.299396  ORF Transcript_106544/g.299396 Transcript_106544/m.299396 type:complete len:333 (+) Transcript_106544:63-1061(+)